jgi:hypothetical protein
VPPRDGPLCHPQEAGALLKKTPAPAERQQPANAGKRAEHINMQKYNPEGKIMFTGIAKPF